MTLKWPCSDGTGRSDRRVQQCRISSLFGMIRQKPRENLRGRGQEKETKGKARGRRQQGVSGSFITSFVGYSFATVALQFILPQSSIYNHSCGTALSDHVLSLSHASQSDLVVGSSPMPFTFQIPKANISMLHSMYTILTPSSRLDVPGVSYGANVR